MYIFVGISRLDVNTVFSYIFGRFSLKTSPKFTVLNFLTLKGLVIVEKNLLSGTGSQIRFGTGSGTGSGLGFRTGP